MDVATCVATFGALAAAGAATVPGFDNAYGPGSARTLDGVWTHVDRAQLARECLRAARHRGAAALPVVTIGPLVDLPRGEVEVRADEAYLRASTCWLHDALCGRTGTPAPVTSAPHCLAATTRPSI
ncbi:MAG: hypothetical protein ACRDSZ_05695 [Pseudonocardiaceae bacterium]